MEFHDLWATGTTKRESEKKRNSYNFLRFFFPAKGKKIPFPSGQGVSQKKKKKERGEKNGRLFDLFLPPPRKEGKIPNQYWYDGWVALRGLKIYHSCHCAGSAREGVRIVEGKKNNSPSLDSRRRYWSGFPSLSPKSLLISLSLSHQHRQHLCTGVQKWIRADFTSHTHSFPLYIYIYIYIYKILLQEKLGD